MLAGDTSIGGIAMFIFVVVAFFTLIVVRAIVKSHKPEVWYKALAFASIQVMCIFITIAGYYWLIFPQMKGKGESLVLSILLTIVTVGFAWHRGRILGHWLRRESKKQ